MPIHPIVIWGLLLRDHILRMSPRVRPVEFDTIDTVQTEELEVGIEANFH